MRVHQISELGHELATLSTGGVEAPSRVESLARCLDGTVDVLGPSLGDLGDRLAVCGVDDTMKGLEPFRLHGSKRKRTRGSCQ